MKRTVFDKARISGHTLNNRYLLAPMTRVSADLNGIPGPEMVRYYAAFAQGGFGGIITEGIYTDTAFSKAYPNQPGLTTEAQAAGWQQITREVKRHGTAIIAQLMHAGGISQALSETRAPSAVRPLGEKLAHYGGGGGPFPIPQALSVTEIEQVIAGFEKAAAYAKQAGFDGIELHAANGYLLDQFLTPYLNLRSDHYGGSVENCLRIIAEIAERIRSTTEEGFVLGLRISEGKVNNLNYRWEEGSKKAIEILEKVKELPIDYLHVAAEHAGWMEEVRYKDGTSLTGLAKQLLDVPVIANGKLHDVELALELLDSEQADFFAIGKTALANPDFVSRIKSGQELRPFRPESLYPNPSLFTDAQHEEFQRQALLQADTCA